MESNSCLPDQTKLHYPKPTNVTKQQTNKEHILHKLHDTPLPENARETFFKLVIWE